MSVPPLAYAPKPMPIELENQRVWVAGPKGIVHSSEWLFDGVDEGAVRVKMHRDSHLAGLVIQFHLHTIDHPTVHPYTLVIDANGYTAFGHDTVTFAETHHVPVIATGVPTWVWFTFSKGYVQVGTGPHIGQSILLRGQSPLRLGGGYRRFALGKTRDEGAFELLDVQPMELRVNRNRLHHV